MSDDLRLRGEYEHLPDPIRQLAETGNYWGVAVDKRPHTPRRWKEDRGLLMPYDKAVVMRDILITDGKDACLYLAVHYTDIRPLDFDPDDSGQLRPEAVELLDHYRNVYKAPIEISLSTAGRHVYLRDKDARLPAVGDRDVKTGKIPCEIKNGIIYVTNNWEQACPIPDVDDHIIELTKQLTPKQQPVAPKTRPMSLSAHRLLCQMRWMHAHHKPYIPGLPGGHDVFGGWHKRLKRLGFSVNTLLTIARQHCELFGTPWKEDDYGADIRQSTKDVAPIGEILTKEFERLLQAGFDPKADLSKHDHEGRLNEPVEPLEDDDPTRLSPSLGNCGGFKEALARERIAVGYDELLGPVVFLPDKGWLPLKDGVFAVIQTDYIANKYRMRRGKTDKPFEVPASVRWEVMSALLETVERQNTTRTWLLSIKRKREYVKEDWQAIDTFIECYKIDYFNRLKNLGYNDDQIKDYYRHGVMLVIGGVVLRSLYPGYPIDKFPVFCGQQGCGKGLGLMLLLPPEEITASGKVIPNKAFRDRCHLIDGRQYYFHNRQGSLCEVTELAGLDKPGNERLKAFLSATEDVIEEKYKNFSTINPRHMFFVGSTNEEHFKPADETGDRRYYPMDVGMFFDDDAEVSEMMPKILDDEWRLRAFGHALWMIEQGYTASPKDWSMNTRKMRQMSTVQAQRRYEQLEDALDAIWRKLQHGQTGNLNADLFRGFTYLSPDEIAEKGLPINPSKHPSNMMTWMRLLIRYDQINNYRLTIHKNKLKIAAEHLGWVHKDYCRVNGRVIRGCLVPPRDKLSIVASEISPSDATTDDGDGDGAPSSWSATKKDLDEFQRQLLDDDDDNDGN